MSTRGTLHPGVFLWYIPRNALCHLSWEDPSPATGAAQLQLRPAGWLEGARRQSLAHGDGGVSQAL